MSHDQSAVEMLEPPLRLVWSFANAMPNPLVSNMGLWVPVCNEYGLARLQLDGREVWRRSDGLYGMALSSETLVAVVSDAEARDRRLCLVDGDAGQNLRTEPARFPLQLLLPDGLSYVGGTYGPDEEGFESKTLARVSLDPGLPILWQIETRDRRDKFGDADVWDSGIAFAEGCLFVGRGPYLVCLDAETGEERWRASMEKVGGGLSGPGRQPIVVGDRAITHGPGGLIGFDRRTGEVAWTLPILVAKAVHGDRLYLLEAGDRARYAIVDAHSGEVLLNYPIAERIRDKYGAKSSGKWRGGTLFTRPAVTETHVFFGDDAGRLWAIERETGEPVWYHKPKGNAGYLAATPIISGNRLYITSFSMDPKKPQALYCYEQA